MQLYDYQVEIMRKIEGKRKLGLYLEMRMGKTILSIKHLKSLKAKSVLVIAPISAHTGWIQDAKNDYAPMSAQSSQKKFIVSWLSNKNPFMIINKEVWRTYPEIKDYPWDAIVIDESTCIKNPQAKVTKFFMKNFRSTPIRLILTGTPAPESPLNYYAQINFLDSNAWDSANYWEWRAKHFRADYSGFNFTPTKNGLAYINSILSKYTYSSKRSYVGMGVKKLRRVITAAPLGFKAQQAYDVLMREFILEMGGKEYKRTKFAGARFSWLRQMLGGFIADEYMVYNKVNALIDFLDGRSRQFVVFAHHTAEVELLGHILGLPTIYGATKQGDRVQRVEDFQAGLHRGLVVNPLTLGYGTKLSAADTVIYYQTPLSNEVRMQSEDRVIFKGKKFINVYDVIIPNTADEIILKNVLQKRKKTEIYEAIQRFSNNV